MGREKTDDNKLTDAFEKLIVGGALNIAGAVHCRRLLHVVAGSSSVVLHVAVVAAAGEFDFGPGGMRRGLVVGGEGGKQRGVEGNCARAQARVLTEWGRTSCMANDLICAPCLLNLSTLAK